ncbi:MAG: glycosyltransferase family 2 protein [Chloroflexota bacterium]
MPLVSIILPFYNEEACVEQVLIDLRATLQKAGLRFEIIAVQNGSWDRTAEILTQLSSLYSEVRVVDIPVNKGFGFGVLQGAAASKGDVVGWMPGDGQVPAISVPQVLSEMARTASDIGKTCRINRNDGWIRSLASRVMNTFARVMLGVSTRDVDGTPKLFRREVLQALRLRSNDSFVDMEALVKARRLGLKVCEVDVPSQPRVGGRSKVRVLETSVEFIGNVLRARFARSDPWGLRETGRQRTRSGEGRHS